MGAGVWGQSPQLGDVRTEFKGMGAGVWGQSLQLGDESTDFEGWEWGSGGDTPIYLMRYRLG
jgi:hypothetical protein